ncbi:MAG: winged helix DNA-binding protein, partial [Alphaproteobacteria bacterium]|nr:winged helix DNA-binding protein [Alphaproteobacteria bacterium]
MTMPYYDSINLIERLHRQFLDVLKVELERAGILDINNVQSMILHNIGTDELTVGELTVRGYYLGSNVSYNVKKMVENGYLIQERSVHDKRSVRVKLSDKGRELNDAIACLYKKHG